MSRGREDHAHLELFAIIEHFLNDWFERVGLDRVRWGGGIKFGIIFLHLLPDVIGDGDSVSIEVHGVGSDDVGLGSETDGRSDGLTREHVGSVEFS